MAVKHEWRREVPSWIRNIPLSRIDDLEGYEFPLSNIVEFSLFYPAAGVDGRPVAMLNGFIHSFIYVDYGVSISVIDNEVFKQNNRSGFYGYEPIGRKELRHSDFSNRQYQYVEPTRYLWDIEYEYKRNSTFVNYGFFALPKHQDIGVGNGFAVWYILERKSEYGSEHGPKRFSFLYIGAEAVATYQALFWNNVTAPWVLALIRPGAGLGPGYTDLCSSDGLFSWTVWGERRHKRPGPHYLLVEYDTRTRLPVINSGVFIEEFRNVALYRDQNNSSG